MFVGWIELFEEEAKTLGAWGRAKPPRPLTHVLHAIADPYTTCDELRHQTESGGMDDFLRKEAQQATAPRIVLGPNGYEVAPKAAPQAAGAASRDKVLSCSEGRAQLLVAKDKKTLKAALGETPQNWRFESVKNNNLAFFHADYDDGKVFSGLRSARRHGKALNSQHHGRLSPDHIALLKERARLADKGHYVVVAEARFVARAFPHVGMLATSLPARALGAMLR